MQAVGLVAEPKYPGLHSVMQVGYVTPETYCELLTENETGQEPAVQAVSDLS